MMRWVKYIGVVALWMAIFPSSCFAWDSFGHMMVAEIAWQRMPTEVRQRAAQLIKLNPSYARWTAGVPPDIRDEFAFLLASTWPDEIKSDPQYQFDGNRPSGPEAERNIGYADTLQHRYWHFIDIPFSPDATPLQAPLAPNAQTQIAVFRAALGASGLGPEIKSYDLVWLLHLVGDVHQPLHATSRFKAMTPHGDNGGNSVQICVNGSCGGNLHSFWDAVLGRSDDVHKARDAALTLDHAEPDIAAIADERTWINESFELAKSTAYKSTTIGAGIGPFVLDSLYRSEAAEAAKKRIALAGVRLALLLNSALR